MPKKFVISPAAVARRKIMCDRLALERASHHQHQQQIKMREEKEETIKREEKEKIRLEEERKFIERFTDQMIQKLEILLKKDIKDIKVL